MKPFPIPVRAIGPGSQDEDETLAYLKMPDDMGVYAPPPLPHAVPPQALAVLTQVVQALTEARPAPIPLHGLDAAARDALNTVLGEGEVSARIAQPDGGEVHVQEAVFAGVWRVITTDAQGRVRADQIEIGPAPLAFAQGAAQGLWPAPPAWVGALPDGVVNAPALIAEVAEKAARWQPGQPADVVNLTLLPMSPADIAFLDHHLGTGDVTVLSRGYGNCRITSTRLAHAWRVVYYNSADAVILNSVEITALPEVALAAPEDLGDAHERLADILALLADDGHV